MILTSEQLALLPEVRNERVALGRSIDPAQVQIAERAVASVYRLAGLEPPARFLWLGSPMAGMIASLMLAALESAGEMPADSALRDLRERVGEPVSRARLIDDPLKGVFLDVSRRVDGPLLGAGGPPVTAEEWQSYLRPTTAAVSNEVQDRTTDEVWYGVGEPIQSAINRSMWPDDGLNPSLWVEHAALVWRQIGQALAPRVVEADPQDWDTVGSRRWKELLALAGPDADETLRWELRGATWQLGRGQHESSFLGFLAYFERLGLQEVEPARGLLELSRSCGWWWPLARAVILTERPRSLVLERSAKRRGVLTKAKIARIHAEDGPAVAYADGFSVYAWHGTAVPPEVVMDPQSISYEVIEAEGDIRVRRVMIERYGKARYTEERARRKLATQARVEADPLVFAPKPYGGSNEHVLVVSADPERASAALRQAGERFRTVTAGGREISDEGEDEPDLGELGGAPSYVSDVGLTERGPFLYVDCKGDIPAPMRSKLLEILEEEISKAGLTDARLEHPSQELFEQ
jgi:hypothetical protein